MKAAIVFAVFAVLATGVWLTAPPRTASDLLIEQAIAKPLPEGAAAFLTIMNRGQPDRLLSVSSKLADVSLYSPASDNGLPVRSGPSSLALDAAHIRILADPPLADGTLLPLTLVFEHAGKVTTRARMSDAATTGPAKQVGLFGLGDICVVGEGEPAPALTLRTKHDADGWHVAIEAQDFEFSKDLLGLYHVPGMGHGHIYVGGMKLGRMFTPDFHIGALPPGRHEVRVTLNTNDHRAYVVDDLPVTAFATIVVD